MYGCRGTKVQRNMSMKGSDEVKEYICPGLDPDPTLQKIRIRVKIPYLSHLSWTRTFKTGSESDQNTVIRIHFFDMKSFGVGVLGTVNMSGDLIRTRPFRKSGSE